MTIYDESVWPPHDRERGENRPDRRRKVLDLTRRHVIRVRTGETGKDAL